MKEVSQEEFVKVRDSLIRRARKLEGSGGICFHYSPAFRNSPSYGRWQWHWPVNWTVRHFCEPHCSGLRRSDVVTCLLKSPNGTYFIGEHTFGDCQVFKLANEPTDTAQYNLKVFVKLVKPKFPQLDLSSYMYDAKIIDSDRPSRTTLRRYFGPWPQVLEAARALDAQAAQY